MGPLLIILSSLSSVVFAQAPQESFWCKLTTKASSIEQQVSYYVSKLPEAAIIFDSEALNMLKVGMAAQKNKTNSRMMMVPLKDVKLFHPVDNANAIAKSAHRADALRLHKDEILKDGALKSKDYDKYIPSIDPIQLVTVPAEKIGEPETYMVIQGQGRMVSIKAVFPKETLVEVEVSDLDAKNLKNLLKVKKGYIANGKLRPTD